jgi:hypothetical protein
MERGPGDFRPEGEQSKKSDTTQPPQEAGKDSSKLPQPQKEPIPLLDSIARTLRKAAQREGNKDFEPSPHAVEIFLYRTLLQGILK